MSAMTLNSNRRGRCNEVTLRTDKGEMVAIRLDHSGDGIDSPYLCWELRPDGWNCLETGAVASETKIATRQLNWHLIMLAIALGLLAGVLTAMFVNPYN